MEEEWRDVPGFPGYRVSDQGRVIGKRGKLIRPAVGHGGYHKISAYVGGEKINASVHRMVAMAFHGPAPDGRPWVAHGDGDPTNNSPSNLRWATAKENSADRESHGRTFRARGALCGTAKVSEAEALDIKSEYGAGVITQSMLGEVFGLTHQAVWSIVNGKNWGHLDA